MRWLIEHDEVDGVVNLAAPRPLPNVAFMGAIRDRAACRSESPDRSPHPAE